MQNKQSSISFQVSKWLFISIFTVSASFVFAQTEDNEHTHESAEHVSTDSPHGEHASEVFKPGDYAVHHIADANTFHIYGELYLPLPVILYSTVTGWTMTMSSSFHPHHHSNGQKAIDGYVMLEGGIQRVTDPSFPMGVVEIEGHDKRKEEVNKKKVEAFSVKYQGKSFDTEKKTVWDGGITGGKITSFYDFSITKNVFTMIFVLFLMIYIFFGIRSSYQKREGQAPKGIQSLLEPIILFVRDEVAKPNLGAKYEKFMPFLLSLFFFILGLNLIGQIPFFPGSANVTGNISVTIVLAICVFLMTNFNGNAHYWGHIVWMPGVPAWLKIIILTPIEILGVFLKPFTLMLRLFANITAGHIVILSFVGLIFVFGKAGASVGGTALGAAISVPLSLFMSTIELLVAFLQAFIFTMLTASYIGAAIEEPHHH